MISNKQLVGHQFTGLGFLQSTIRFSDLGIAWAGGAHLNASLFKQSDSLIPSSACFLKAVFKK